MAFEWLCRNYLLKLSCSSKRCDQTSRWRDILAETVNHSVPAQIAFEIPSCNAMKFHHPLFESAVISIDVLYVIDAAYHPLVCGNIDWTVNDPHMFGDYLVRGYAIRA